MGKQEHWESVYGRKAPDQVSWYRRHLERSLAFIEGAGLSPEAAIIDVGGGTSTLVDDLLGRGYSNVTVLDISAAAIANAKARLGAKAADVTWIVADITSVALPTSRCAFWHDRAVFHFLVAAADRRRYVATVSAAVKPDGHVLVATFGPQGPERCSGLDVVRYSADGLQAEFGAGLEKIASAREVHTTPWGVEQEFLYCLLQRAGVRQHVDHVVHGAGNG
jgi:SAM-dependent methyltransferase